MLSHRIDRHILSKFEEHVYFKYPYRIQLNLLYFIFQTRKYTTSIISNLSYIDLVVRHYMTSGHHFYEESPKEILVQGHGFRY